MKTTVPFDKISKSITRDIKLTDSAYRLMVLIINNQTDWKINTSYYQKLLGWSNDKLSNATKNLIELGYLTRTKINKGNKGFGYQYEINLDIQKEVIKEIVRPLPIETIQPEEKATQIEENPSIESLLEYFEELYISYDEPESIYGEVKHKIEAGAISNFMEISAEFQLNKILTKKLKIESKKPIDENDKEITKESLLDYIENNASKLGWVKSIKIQDAVNNDSIKTINEILNY